MSDRVRMSIADATTLIEAALVASGVEEVAARSVAIALVSAEAEGQVGHGFSRLGDYAAQVKSGKIKGRPNVTITRTQPASLLIDADCGFAYPAMDQAIADGVPVARELGIAIMGIRNSHHCGALSLQVEKIARAGLIGLMVANGPKAIAPWGSHVPVFGTNPIAFAVPRAGTDPLVIDLSLSKVARGKVMNAMKTGQDIPEGWALDAEGHPTTDPAAALEGTMLPIGDAKGTALALMVEVLAGVLTGSALSYEATSFFAAEGAPPRVGQTFIAIRPAADRASAFPERLESLLEHIARLEGARLPGTRRQSAIEAARADGLNVPRAYVDIAKRLANAP